MKLMHICFIVLYSLVGTASAQTSPLVDKYMSNAIPVPPPEHPRVFINNEILPRIKENLASDELKDVWQRMQLLSKTNDPGLQPITDSTKGNFKTQLTSIIQARAVVYLFDKDREAGRVTINMMSDFLRKVVFPEKLDVTRNIGETIHTAAIVYDWCYELLTPGEKIFFIAALKKLAASMEIGYPPVKQGGVVGHGSEAQLMRDLLSAGIAVYGEDKEIYNLSANRFFHDFVPIRNYWSNSEMHHQGDSYGSYRYQWEVFAAFLFERMGYKNIFIDEHAVIPSRWIYTRRPDGQLLRDGDSYKASQAKIDEYWSFPLPLMLASNYYKDPFLKYEFLKQNALRHSRGAISDLWMILFSDPSIKPSPAIKLSNTKFFGDPSGLMVARTGWDSTKSSNTVVAEMKIGGIWFANHQHLDAGSFQLYYKGALAIDAGIYEGTQSAYGSAHDRNYHKRTIAHNTMLVFDSSEKFVWSRFDLANDGGQRFPNSGYEPYKAEELFSKDYRVAKVLSHYTGIGSLQPVFSYLEGDLTKAYSDKVADYKRSFVFINFKDSVHPAAMIVYDRIESSQPNLKKSWLLHAMEEPVIANNDFTISRTEHGYSGRLVNTTLLPNATNSSIRKIGGVGRAFEVNGVNYPQSLKTEDGAEEPGAWRVELSPVRPAKKDVFLNVLQVMDNNEAVSPLKIGYVDFKDLAGVLIKDKLILLSKKTAKLDGPLQFNVATNTQGSTQVLITGLREGQWELSRAGKPKIIKSVTAAAGVIEFESAAGRCDARRLK